MCNESATQDFQLASKFQLIDEKTEITQYTLYMG